MVGTVDGPRSDLVVMLHRVGERMRRHYSEVCAEHGLTPPLAAFLREIEEPSAMRVMADRLCFDASYITALVDRLEGLGMVGRRPSPGDRRVKQVVITDRGRQARDSIAGALDIDQVLPGLDDATAAELVGLLGRALGLSASQ
jgi:DNA-binding MarR family transcriptional regulator